MKRSLILVLIYFCALPSRALAKEYATFEVFYKQTSEIDWIIVIIFAILAAAVVYFSAGTATPVVASIGTYIGNLAGLSGAAATNFGLALLGGGSIKAGGLGVAGGVAFLTAVFSFSADVVIDYAGHKAYNEYSYEKFVEQSKDMITLPLPRNDDGSKNYEDALTLLEHINEQESYFSNGNQDLITKAIETLKNPSTTDREYVLKEMTLLALLYFNKADYKKSKEYAEIAINVARDLKLRRTLPAFIYAVSSMYDDNINFFTITSNYFRYSLLAEPDNKLIPLMYAIYMDRIMYRIEDGGLTEAALYQLAEIAEEPSIDDYYETNLSLILTRYFFSLKLHQQVIYSLTQSENEIIANSPKTLQKVKESYDRYQQTIGYANALMVNLLFQEKNTIGDYSVSHSDSLQKKKEFYELLQDYIGDKTNLLQAINGLEASQNGADKKVQVDSFEKTLLLILIVVFSVVSLAIGFAIGKRARVNSIKSEN